MAPSNRPMPARRLKFPFLFVHRCCSNRMDAGDITIELYLILGLIPKRFGFGIDNPDRNLHNKDNDMPRQFA